MNYGLIYGLHPIIEAICANKDIEKILVSKDMQRNGLQNIKEILKDNNKNIRLQFVPKEKLDSVTHHANHQGVVAYISNIIYRDLEEVLEEIKERSEKPLIIFLDHITDVRNFGAISRTGECVGVNCIIIPSEGNAPINMDSIKTSAGALMHIPICKSLNAKTTINLLKQNGIKILAASEHTSNIYTQVDMRPPICIVMGAENRGISKEILKIADENVKIPMKGSIESLNVSVAAGILLYESLRQSTSQMK